MRHLRLAAIAFALFAVAGTTLAGATTSSSVPQNLRAFLLHSDEPTMHAFPRTPAFAWSPVRGARWYEFELGTSKTFTENSLIWSNVPGVVITKASFPTSRPTVPAISIDTALPWFTGVPYALYAHVRAVTSSGPTRWSKAFGFDVRWQDVPKPMSSVPGLVRWTPVEGATSYQVWYQDTDTPLISTNTNVADEREYYSFHSDPSWTAAVHWRVRAVRQVFGVIPNGLPAVSYGPWSPVYTSSNPVLSTGPVALKEAISDKISDSRKQSAHELMPAVTWTGSSIQGRQFALWRPYAFTDRDCVNVVFTGSVIGSPAFAPRTSGPLKLPASDTDLQIALSSFLPSATAEGPTFSADGGAVTSNEAMQTSTTSTSGSSGSSSSSSGSSSSSSGSGSSTTTAPAPARARVDLPDLNFPTTRYYWTLVPVGIIENEGGGLAYRDLEVPQDACAAGRIASYGKQSAPVVTTATGTPFVAGLSPKGRLLASVSRKPVVYGTPLVAWKPAKAATAYEIQWSRTLYPWRSAGAKATFSTSTLLSLKPGNWYYRVRGLNAVALGLPFMSWSTPVRLTVAKPTFRLVSN